MPHLQTLAISNRISPYMRRLPPILESFLRSLDAIRSRSTMRSDWRTQPRESSINVRPRMMIMMSVSAIMFGLSGNHRNSLKNNILYIGASHILSQSIDDRSIDPEKISLSSQTFLSHLVISRQEHKLIIINAFDSGAYH